jgi:long-chain acyl-CoA synthetase
MDVAARIATVLRLDADRRAVQYQGRWCTWGDVATTVDAIDGILTGAGLGRGSSVGLVTRNRPPHVAALEGLLSTRRCVVPISSIGSDSVVASDVEALGVPAVIADEQDWARARLAERCAAAGVLGILAPTQGGDVRVVAGLESPRRDPGALPGVAVLMPTSGTTGPPKRIRYTYEQLDGALGRIARYSAATGRALGGPPALRDGVVLATLALAHVSGFWTVLQAAAEGRPVALLDRFEPGAWADLVEEHGSKTSALPPATLRMVMDAAIEPHKLRSLLAVNCGTAPLDPDLAEAFTERYGVPVLVSYGATEFPGGTVGWTLDDHRRFGREKRGSAGRARPGIAIRIVDAVTGAVVPVGQEGILAVRSPQAVADGADGWVRTNDIGRMDADGFLWLVGRADDAINRGGFKVVPQVVEAVLRDHPAVVDAAVSGIPHARLGQVPVAAVTVAGPVGTDELVEWVRDRLSSYQVPTEIRIVDELPRTASLKVAKDDVRRMFTAP